MITAIQTLTILPMPLRGSARFAAALPYFSLVGALLGGLVMLGMKAVSAGGLYSYMIAGAVGLTLSVLLNRGLHQDGLADVVDALGSGPDRARRLAVMKDPHIGSFGVLALIVIGLLKFAAFTTLAVSHLPAAMILAFVNARYLQVQLAFTLPYARSEGGTAHDFVADARLIHLLVAGAVALALGLVASGWAGAALFLVVVLLGMFLAQWMRRAFGGVTGDLLGFGSEIAETLQLLVIAQASIM